MKRGVRKWLWGITWMLCLAAIWRISHLRTTQDPERRDPSFFYALFGNTAERAMVPALDVPRNWDVKYVVQEAAASMILPALVFAGHVGAELSDVEAKSPDGSKQGEADPTRWNHGEIGVEPLGENQGEKSEATSEIKEEEAGPVEEIQGLTEVGIALEEGMETPKLPRISKGKEIPAELLSDYGELVKNFYQIDPTTMADAGLLDAERFLSKDLRIDLEVDGPQILIFHTHSQEAYADSVSGDPKTTVVGVGEELTRILEETYGYQVLHHEEVYDKPSRNGAYSRALPKIKALLSENPGIQVVIDLHRDEMPEKTRLVTEVNGKKTAKFMFFNGISRLKETGPLDYLRNDNLEENLAFSFQMEKAAQEYYPGLTRKIYLKGYRYNMHLAPKMLLVELGAQNNTLEEAMNACEPLAALLDLVLSGEP
ncbi:MAG: stage II sporulation protein P [Lachnospiraceae bacterium]|nr:stage II sporulation protein P [Lachnospiraceae bacterium]